MACRRRSISRSTTWPILIPCPARNLVHCPSITARTQCCMIHWAGYSISVSACATKVRGRWLYRRRPLFHGDCMRLFHLTLMVAFLLSLRPAAWASPIDIVIDDRNVFPESFSATPDGTLYIGSNLGRIYRVKPGQAYAEPWLSPQESGLHEGLRGVLADKASNTLWVCDNDGKESSLIR